VVSILILTLNEESSLSACLASVAWSDDIVVFDSMSTDRTVAIARAAGARVVQRPFDDWATHQNWAAANISFRHPWVYYADADERVTPELRDELLRIAADPAAPHAAYRVRFRNRLAGRWLRHASLYPTWVLRFFRPDRVRWEREVNPVPVVRGSTGFLAEHFEHYAFSRGFTEWIAKHNRYASGEATEMLKTLRQPWRGRDCFRRDPAARRQAFKRLAYRMPSRPLLVFVYLYVLRGGFLDGSPGLQYCRLRALYERMIDSKVWELRQQQQGRRL
jgi:glycosyltransferase involved in cell wall biosynthesis